MAAIDNFSLVAQFVPEQFDGDTFLYTELLDRSKRSGPNKGRRVQTFYHRTRQDFVDQIDRMREMCEYFKVRAYTRLSPRSFKTVGKEFTKMIVEQSLAGNWEGMRHAYSHACGNSKPIKKYWLFDVDNPVTLLALERLTIDNIRDRKEFVCSIPSRSGYHLITTPFDTRELHLGRILLHKDNPTNLYIPEDAA